MKTNIIKFGGYTCPSEFSIVGGEFFFQRVVAIESNTSMFGATYNYRYRFV